MRILVIHNFYAQRGGEDTVVEAELKALQEAGHEARLYEARSASLESRPLAAAFNLACLRHNPLKARDLGAALKDWRPDVAHVHNVFPCLSLSPYAVLRKANIPVVQTLHNYRFLCAPATLLRQGQECRLCAQGDFKPGVRYACFRESRLLSLGYGIALAKARRRHWLESRVSRFICVSQYVKDAFVQAGFSLDQMDIKGHFLEGGTEAAFTRQGPALYLGRLSEEKGAGILGQALGRMKGGAETKIAGQGPMEGYLRALGLKGVSFLGYLDKEALRRELRQALFTVAPSICPETFGLSVLEAFAAGKPVVASNIGALPELVKDGQTGLLARPGDAADLAAKMGWMFAHPEDCERMGRAALAVYREKFGQKENMVQLQAIYEKVVRR